MNTVGEQDLDAVLNATLKAQNKYKYIGLGLNIPSYVIEKIERSEKDSQDRLCRVLEEYLKQTNPNPTWGAIVAALRKDKVNEPRLAKTIEDKYSIPSTTNKGMEHNMYYRLALSFVCQIEPL